MKYDLIKVTQEKYAIDILKGNLYMNPLSFFRKYENDYMDDITEGACGDIPKNQMRQYGYYFPDDIIESMVYDNVLMLSDYFANCNLFCMYCLERDDRTKQVVSFDEKLFQFSDTIVWIKDVDEFRRRIEKVFREKCQDNIYEYGSYGKIRYYDLDEKTGSLEGKSCFDKRKDYQWQKEWRICVWSHNMRNEAIFLQIGDISDIACIIPAKDIISTLEQHYKDYTFVKEIGEQKPEIYTTISNGNVISKLMSRYSDIKICQFPRSDKAEALSHLSRYYELEARLDEAEKTLKEIIEVEKSWVNYKLLLDFYMRTHKYSQAENVYWDIIKNNLDLIEDKEDFFYMMHQFFMHFEKAYEAGVVYTLWSKEYFSGERALALEHDIYVGLEMSDKAIETADLLKEKYGDREILDYYYAVNYLYLLEVDKSRYYLNKFKKKYSANLKQNEYVNKLEDKLNILEGKGKIIVEKDVIRFLNEINPTREEIDKLKQQITSICVVEDTTLYALFKAGCENYLNSCKKILITAQVVHDIVNEYCVTGDKYLLKIIEFIKDEPRVSIKSPALKDIVYKSFEDEDKDDMGMLMIKVLAMELEVTLEHKRKNLEMADID